MSNFVCLQAVERLVTRGKLNSVFLQCLKYTSLKTLLSQREKIMNCSITSNKKVRPSAHPEIERATVEWFNSRSAKDANLSRPISNSPMGFHSRVVNKVGSAIK